MKLILTGFVVPQENIKPEVLKVPTEQDLGLYVFLYNTKLVSMRMVKVYALSIQKREYFLRGFFTKFALALVDITDIPDSFVRSPSST